ncbi:hypothetical protein PENCOP_c002G00671 [Penicillium coprophilum]|uniref:NAD(P)-binding domain-containing protein n=1 Tax=Penicillium coprophilum TaxID=36646 RepID=A0A1V6V262_9EURO|nr:hypothetical protein PENCOP_c002G00671 [Penicillium coprophilum]
MEGSISRCFGEAYNIQSSHGITNLEVAVRTLELFGYSARDFTHSLTWIPDRPFNDTDYWVDGSKLAAWGWRQRVPFSEGLKASVNWYGKNLETWWPEVSNTINAASTATTEVYIPPQLSANVVEDIYDGKVLEGPSGLSAPVMVAV